MRLRDGGCGLEEGLLLVSQDVLRGVRWHGVDVEDDLDDEDAWERSGRAVEEADIPTAAGVHQLAAAAAARRGVWSRELEVLLVAYSGMRWGEHVALTADRVDPDRRRITVDRQVIGTRHGLKLAPPKNRRRRTTMFPAKTPAGVDLAAFVEPGSASCPATGCCSRHPKGTGRHPRPLHRTRRRPLRPLLPSHRLNGGATDRHPATNQEVRLIG